LITSKIKSSIYFKSFSPWGKDLDRGTLLYLSIKRIASFTHTHIKPNIPNCAGNDNGNQSKVNENIAHINRNGITDNTRNGCLKLPKCNTNTENIKIIQIPNALSKSFIEFCMSATSHEYSK
jgi:hypothetical protein